jgi:hypothetical protein
MYFILHMRVYCPLTPMAWPGRAAKIHVTQTLVFFPEIGAFIIRSTDRTGELINYYVFSESRTDGLLDRALDGRDSRTRSG